MMTPEEIAEYVGDSVEYVLSMRSRRVGTTARAWRCGERGTISESEYECSCDSVFCSLGEWVTVTPEQERK